jgi:hypothetical protein
MSLQPNLFNGLTSEQNYEIVKGLLEKIEKEHRKQLTEMEEYVKKREEEWKKREEEKMDSIREYNEKRWENGWRIKWEEKLNIWQICIVNLMNKAHTVITRNNGHLVVKFSKPKDGNWFDAASYIPHYYPLQDIPDEGLERIFLFLTSAFIGFPERCPSFVDVIGPREVPLDVPLEDFYKEITWQSLV